MAKNKCRFPWYFQASLKIQLNEMMVKLVYEVGSWVDRYMNSYAYTYHVYCLCVLSGLARSILQPKNDKVSNHATSVMNTHSHNDNNSNINTSDNNLKITNTIKDIYMQIA